MMRQAMAKLMATLATGEAEGVAADCIPIGFGLILQAVMAVATAAQIAETSAEIANAPWTFMTEVNATHDLAVHINHDPNDTQDTASITIKENLVLLIATTVYIHKEKVGLDAAGNHIWVAGPPPAPQPATCDNVPGNLCILQSIAVSETFGAVGYAWKSYSKGVTDFNTGAAGQLYQFANISFTDGPQRGWMHSGGGFSSPAPIAYDRSSPASHNFYIDPSSGKPFVRRITMSAVDVPPVIDAPGGCRSRPPTSHAACTAGVAAARRGARPIGHQTPRVPPDKKLDPVNASLLGSQAIVFASQDLAQLVQQPG